MKKVTTTILIVLYLAFTTGVIVNMHYCMDKVDSVALYQAADDVCDKCGMHIDEAMGCCRDEVKVYKIDDDQRSAVVAFHFENIDQPLVSPSLYIETSLDNLITPTHYFNHSPPLLSGQDLCIQHSVFRI